MTKFENKSFSVAMPGKSWPDEWSGEEYRKRVELEGYLAKIEQYQRQNRENGEETH